MWPNLTDDWIASEVGHDCLFFLNDRLHAHLFGSSGRQAEIHFRLAPSIIARSECEVLSLSAPRFAVRASFTNGSFVNLRRVMSVARWAQDWRKPLPESARFTDRPATQRLESPAETLKKASQRCIAEGLIVPPDRLSERYHLLTTKLFCAFGEALCEPDSDLAGVPFVQSIPLGGGLCAQAVCFMAACALANHAKGIHGLGEISAIVANCLDSEEDVLIPLGGLDGLNICDYFNSSHVGLAATVLSNCNMQNFFGTDPPRRWLRLWLLAMTIDAYVRSGMPVILLVDAVKLPHYYARCGSSAPSGTGRPERHALLVVGTERRPGCKTHFLVNDPSHLPLMPITHQELVHASLSRDEIVHCVAVTPPAVKAHLIDSFSRGTPQRGLFWCFATVAHTYGGAVGAPDALANCFAPGPGGKLALGEFLLIPSEPTRRLELAGNVLGQSVAAALATEPEKPQVDWQWMQYRKTDDGEAIILWDATKEITSIEASRPDKASKLICAAWFRANDSANWKRVYWRSVSRGDDAPLTQLPTEAPEGSKRVSERDQALTPSIITSFVGADLKRGLQILRTHLRDRPLNHVDIYAMLQSEPFIDPNTTAEAALAELYDDTSRLQGVAKSIVDSLTRSHCTPSGLATFFPSLSFDPSHKLAELSRRALQATWLIASHLQSAFQKDLVIEIVGGSRALGIYPAVERHHGEDTVVAVVLGWQTAIQNLIDNLKIATRAVGKTRENFPRIVLELEPGPLFTVNTQRSLIKFVELLDQCEPLRGRVGLNVDVSHYRLSDVTVEMVRKAPSIRDKIWHAHLSGHHHCAHFGDIPPLVLNSATDFDDWLRLLSELPRGRDAFSGTVALELEATKSPESLLQAIDQFLELVRVD